MRGGNEHEGGGYSVAAARVASILPRLPPEELPPSGGGLQPASLQRATAPCSVRSRVQRLLVCSRRGPEQHDDDFDHRANSLESHLHQWIALGKCDGLADLAMLTTLLTADSTGECELCIVPHVPVFIML
jgi:hypothetical protein